MNKVSIQGQVASFHDIAAKKFFDNPNIVGCETFRETVRLLDIGETDYALVAIENSLYGTINEVYDLILRYKFHICGEVFLRIKQNLIGLKESKISDIVEVHSHPVALAQCEDFLDNVLPNAVRFEHHDTAGSVNDIVEWRDKSKSAIASSEAAEFYGLKILEESIETNKQNYTRFVVLSKNQDSYSANSNKTSLVIQTDQDNKSGSLAAVLNIFSDSSVNVTALHSRPIIGKAWHYMFYIDLELGKNDERYEAVLDELALIGCKVTILGNYKSGLE